MSGERHSHTPEAGPVVSFLKEAGRDRIPGTLPVISFRDEDEHAFLDDLERCTESTVELSRRGHWHGQWAELAAQACGIDLQAELSDLAELQARWHEARPIVLPGILGTSLERNPDEVAEAFELYHELGEAGGLRRWLKARIDQLGPGWRVRDRRAGPSDPERDLERVLIAKESNHRGLRDLWWKSGHLSTVEGDDSLRLRVSFGREPEDDASRDTVRHRAVSEMAEALLPCAGLISAEQSLARMIERVSGEELYHTQQIGYWNAPDGGALFHHDAFEEEHEGGQRGVVYAQLAGRTAWLALSLDDLAPHVREFLQLLSEGELDWVREELFPRPNDLPGALACATDDERLLRELALPGCGRFAALVNRGPEFTDYLANAGHAFLLEAGDVLLMPNFGLASTVMHSVYCADDVPTYAVSAGLRQERFEPEPDPQADARDARHPKDHKPRRPARRRD